MSDEKFLKDVGRRIQKARLALGLSQEDLAQKTNKTQNTISHYENGSRAMSISQLPIFAEALRVPMAYFLSESTAEEELAILKKYLMPIFRAKVEENIRYYSKLQAAILDTYSFLEFSQGNVTTKRKENQLELLNELLHDDEAFQQLKQMQFIDEDTISAMYLGIQFLALAEEGVVAEDLFRNKFESK